MKKQEEKIQAIPLEEINDVECWVNDGEYCTNVPQRIIDHSPTGFAWGYGGSGPADFALNVLSLFVGEDAAYPLHQDFKWDFIASLPETGGTIAKSDILEWIASKGVEI